MTCNVWDLDDMKCLKATGFLRDFYPGLSPGGVSLPLTSKFSLIGVYPTKFSLIGVFPHKGFTPSGFRRIDAAMHWRCSAGKTALNIIICLRFGKSGSKHGQAEEKLRQEKFSPLEALECGVGVFLARCRRGKVLFNFVWFDVKLAFCHFHAVFFGRHAVVKRRVVPNNICFSPI